MSRLSDLGRSYRHLLVGIQAAVSIPKGIVEALVKREETFQYGRALGLNEEQVREVVAAVYASMWRSADIWDEIQRRLILRGLGEKWRP